MLDIFTVGLHSEFNTGALDFRPYGDGAGYPVLRDWVHVTLVFP